MPNQIDMLVLATIASTNMQMIATLFQIVRDVFATALAEL